MAWSTPLTAVSNATLTAAQWNASVRDNLLETAVAKATAAGQLFVSTAANSLAARTPQIGSVATGETTTSTTYADLATTGPQAVVTSGTAALVFISSRLASSVDTTSAYASFLISGSTSSAADDRLAIEFQTIGANRSMRATSALLVTGLTGGSNTFAMRYRVSGGGATGTFTFRQISVLPF